MRKSLAYIKWGQEGGIQSSTNCVIPIIQEKDISFKNQTPKKDNSIVLLNLETNLLTCISFLRS